MDSLGEPVSESYSDYLKSGGDRRAMMRSRAWLRMLEAAGLKELTDGAGTALSGDSPKTAE
jgi:hypothetical protein